MAKIIAFLVFLCLQYSRQEDFPEQATIETYPLDIQLDENDTIHEHVQHPREKVLKSDDAWKTDKAKLKEEYNKVSDAIEKWIKEDQPKFGNYKWLKIVQTGTDAKCANYYYDTKFKGYGKYGDTTQLWSDYTTVTIDIETWVQSYHPSMMNYKWLKIIEEGSYESGTIPRCPTKVESTYDYYEKNSNGGQYGLQGGWQGSFTNEDKMWEEYTQVTLDVEGWIMKANPDLQLYKWLKILEEGGVLKGRIPKCSSKVESMYDYYNKDNGISWKKNQDQLMKAYDKIATAIENWMQKAHPKRSNYKWLDAIDKGTKANCPDNCYGLSPGDYDYYYDLDTTAYLGDTAYGMKLPSNNKPKTQFKRFTSV